MTAVAIIGTAGRDKTKPMTLDTWCAMWQDVKSRFTFDTKDYKLVSGGAAWADHLAVHLFLNLPERSGTRLVLHLPARLERGRSVWKYEETGGVGSACNYYHDKFMEATGIDGRREIAEAIERPCCSITVRPPSPGMGAFFARNDLVAKAADACVAYTWGSGAVPMDGGTRYTWDKIKGRKVHVPIGKLMEKTW